MAEEDTVSVEIGVFLLVLMLLGGFVIGRLTYQNPDSLPTPKGYICTPIPTEPCFYIDANGYTQLRGNVPQTGSIEIYYSNSTINEARAVFLNNQSIQRCTE